MATSTQNRRTDSKNAEDSGQAAQGALMDEARKLPGVAEVLDVYGRLSPYTNVLVNVQPRQVRNATGGNS